MKPHIIIRADGNSQIGLGHLIRCFALAQMLRNDFEITFYCKEIPDTILANLKDNGLGCCKIKEEDEFLSQLNVNKIVVLDGYQFNTNYQKQIKTYGTKLVCIDDMHDKEFVADLIINHAPGITFEDYKVQPYTRFALGLEYSLLRPEFLKQAIKERRIEKIDSILICFGGSDPSDLTGTILNCLQHKSDIHKIIVVVGASYSQTEKLKHSISDHSHIEIKSNLDADALAEIMSNTDLAIVPSSTIALESFISKMILITGVTVENQQNIYKGLLKEDSVIGIGDFSLLTCADLLKSINHATQKFNDYTIHTKLNMNDAVLDVFKSITL